MVISMVYDIHLEKKTFRKEMRQEEHHAAGKLAQVQMELWSQYRDDVQESHEASRLLKQLDATYGEFQGKFQGVVNTFAKSNNLPADKTTAFSDQILKLVSSMQQDNVKHAKHLLDHLASSGKQAEKLEKHIEEDLKDGILPEDLKEFDKIAGLNATGEADP